MDGIKCPACGGKLNYDKFEDCYNCAECPLFWYPAEVGQTANKEAGYLQTGEPHAA